MRENFVLDEAIEWLRQRLPDNWAVERANQPDADPDALLDLKSPSGTFTRIVVEVRQSIEPRDVMAMTSGLARSLRAASGPVQILVIAPWISRRTREILAKERLNYLDLTGNALIRVDNPFIYLDAEGAARNPVPPARSPVRLRGAKAVRLFRLLADVRPPYGVGELAAAAELTAGYVSRLLDALDREAIVTRGSRGLVEDVDVAALLRSWAAGYDVFKPELTTTWIAGDGAAAAAAKLAETEGRVAISGSFAAVRWAPVAAPTQLVVYCDDISSISARLRLLPADEGANVMLLKPFDDVVWARTTKGDDDLPYAAPSQVAVDCLTGTGRMPAEGEALLDWMLENKASWRATSLSAATSS